MIIYIIVQSFFREPLVKFVQQQGYKVKFTPTLSSKNAEQADLLILQNRPEVRRDKLLGDLSLPILYIGSIKLLYSWLGTGGGYITPDDPFDIISKAIRSVINGEWFISETVRCFLSLNRLRQQTELLETDLKQPLTRSELEVLSEISKGYTAIQIADRRDCSVSTVHTQCKAARHKLGITYTHSTHHFASCNRYALRTLLQTDLCSQKIHIFVRSKSTISPTMGMDKGKDMHLITTKPFSLEKGYNKNDN